MAQGWFPACSNNTFLVNGCEEELEQVYTGLQGTIAPSDLNLSITQCDFNFILPGGASGVPAPFMGQNYVMENSRVHNGHPTPPPENGEAPLQHSMTNHLPYYGDVRGAVPNIVQQANSTIDPGRTTSQCPPLPPMKRKNEHTVDQDGDDPNGPDKKRLYTLERNRLAASKCRNKKKMIVQGLQRSYDDLKAKNSQLDSEKRTLKNELLSLTDNFLTHARVCNHPLLNAHIKVASSSPRGRLDDTSHWALLDKSTEAEKAEKSQPPEPSGLGDPLDLDGEITWPSLHSQSDSAEHAGLKLFNNASADADLPGLFAET